MKKHIIRIVYALALLLICGVTFGVNTSSVHAAPLHTNEGESSHATANEPARVFDCKGERDGHFNILSDHTANWNCFEGSGTLKNLAIHDANLVCTGNHTGTVTWYGGNNNYYVIPFPAKNVCSPLNDAYANYVMVTEIKIDPS
jgi:hypothetical protein